MRISIFQFDVEWMNPDANLLKIKKVCEILKGQTDLLILPEMFNTGYTMKPFEIPLEWQSNTINTLQNYCFEYDITISGSIPMHNQGKYTNTFIFVGKEGLISSYQKIHLFSMAGEDNVYTPGKKVEFLNLGDVNIQPLICYDLRFPYVSYQNKTTDVIIYSANWPRVRVDHWRSLLQARAIENQCYVIGVNRTGVDENGYEYPGKSMVLDFNGSIIAELGDTEDIITTIVNPEEVKMFKEKLPFLNDRKDVF
ncbi:MAG: nitrilase family protein [Saprospiraceae bacterium]|nr:nitrilase family protein [Saprospiraceae bacterium]